MTYDEKRLVGAFRAGEPGSYEQLYREYSARIYRFCLRLCGNRTDAEDLMQEVFVAAYRGRDSFQARSSLATWLYRIAIYRRQSLHGRRGPETVPLDESRPAMSSDPAGTGIARMSLEAALQALPEHLRVAFLLVKAEGLLCREAAEALGIPEGTLKSRVQAAIVQLQRLLQAEEGTPGQSPSNATPSKKEAYGEL